MTTPTRKISLMTTWFWRALTLLALAIGGLNWARTSHYEQEVTEEVGKQIQTIAPKANVQLNTEGFNPFRSGMEMTWNIGAAVINSKLLWGLVMIGLIVTVALLLRSNRNLKRRTS